MRIAIADDLASDRDFLCKGVHQWAAENNVPLVPDIAVFESGEALLKEFNENKFDLIILDIYMGGMTGMETAHKIRETDSTCRLIFATTSTEFAVDSYEVDSSYYLVKPYTYEKLAIALNRCGANQLEQGQYIDIPGKHGDEKLLLHSIAYTEYSNRRILVHLKDGNEQLVAMNHGDFSNALLPYSYFCDCMKGILVNFEAVDKLLSDCFLLHGGDQVPISRLKYKEVREKFLDYTYAKARGSRL